MKKAFMFDMDGVLADTETLWDKLGYDDMLRSHFGEELTHQVKVSSGLSIKGIFDKFVELGWHGEYQAFHDLNIEIGNQVYPVAQISRGTDKLISYLVEKGFTLAVVSSSPLELIEPLISKLKNRSQISLVLSVNIHPHLKPKPAPDPYLYAMEQLKVRPEHTIILEDSQTGVDAGKSSGAKVIAYTEHNHRFAWQTIPKNADYYASSMSEVRDIVDKLVLNKLVRM